LLFLTIPETCQPELFIDYFLLTEKLYQKPQNRERKAAKTIGTMHPVPENGLSDTGPRMIPLIFAIPVGFPITFSELNEADFHSDFGYGIPQGLS
jgi:hypothetical protein